MILYLPTQIRFSIGGERVTCRGSKLTNSLGSIIIIIINNSLGKQQLWDLDSHLIRPCSLGGSETREPACVNQTISSQFFFFYYYYFFAFLSWEIYSEALITCPAGNYEFFFTLDLNVPLGPMRVSGKQNSLFPCGQSLSAYCFQRVIN